MLTGKENEQANVLLIMLMERADGLNETTGKLLVALAEAIEEYEEVTYPIE